LSDDEGGKVYDITDGEQIDDTRWISQDGNIDPKSLLEGVNELHGDEFDDVVIIADSVKNGFYLFSSSNDARTMSFLLQLGLDRLMKKFND
tara:strand:- start:162 stop:434 length:273 start_codon:yes stop_codon:yes gene_type:complete